MNVLCVVAHQDDESLFCGATLANHARRGDVVTVVSLSDGVGSRFARLADIEPAERERRAMFERACAVLGVKPVSLYVFPDQRSDSVPQLDINQHVEYQIEDFAPDLVYTHHVGDLNLDHRRVAEAVLVATRQGPPVRCMTPEFPTRCVGPKFEPSLIHVVAASTFEQKIAACLCYESELRAYPHPRSEQALREKVEEAFMEIR